MPILRAIKKLNPAISIGYHGLGMGQLSKFYLQFYLQWRKVRGPSF